MAKIPPLRALAVFETAARCGSFWQAARELGITTSAVSHQIRMLERFLDRKMFVRMNRGVRLTIEGAAYFETIHDAYQLIGDGTRKLLDQPAEESLTVRCGVSFGLRWLTPRIPLFLSEYPDIDLQVLTPTGSWDARKPPADIEIRYGLAELPGMLVEPLFEENIIPLCSPALLKGRRSLRDPKDLAGFRLIDSEINVIDWAHFLASHNITLSAYSRLKFDNVLLALQAAVSGLGIALEGDFLAGEELATGRLIVPPALRQLKARKSLRSLVVSEANSHSERVVIFRDWLFRMLDPESNNPVSV